MLNHIIILIAVLTACNNSPTDIENQYIRSIADNYTAIKPLKVNYCRYYKEEIFLNNQKEEFNHSYLITKDTIINNLRWYNTEIAGVLLQTNQDDGLHFRCLDSCGKVIEWLEAKYPGEPGYTWQCLDSYRKIISVDTIITVAAGKFHCYHYYDIVQKINGMMEYSDIFYAPGIGMVLKETFTGYKENSASLSIKWEMTDYHLY